MRLPTVADEVSAARGIRGSARNRQSTIRTGELVVDLKTRVVSVHDKPVRVTCKEYSIFELLSVHKGAIVTKQMLLDHLYDGVDAPELKIIDVFVCNLRKSSPRQPAAIITSKQCGAAAICFATRQHQGPPENVRDNAGGSLRVGSHR